MLQILADAGPRRLARVAPGPTRPAFEIACVAWAVALASLVVSWSGWRGHAITDALGAGVLLIAITALREGSQHVVHVALGGRAPSSAALRSALYGQCGAAFIGPLVGIVCGAAGIETLFAWTFVFVSLQALVTAFIAKAVAADLYGLPARRAELSALIPVLAQAILGFAMFAWLLG